MKSSFSQKLLGKKKSKLHGTFLRLQFGEIGIPGCGVPGCGVTITLSIHYFLLGVVDVINVYTCKIKFDDRSSIGVHRFESHFQKKKNFLDGLSMVCDTPTSYKFFAGLGTCLSHMICMQKYNIV
jgi:hypothetical protein